MAKSAAALPYLTVPDDSVLISASEWHDRSSRSLRSGVRAWDQSVDLFAQSTLSVCPSEIFELCQIPESARIRVVVCWRCPEAMTRGAVWVSDAIGPRDPETRLELAVSIPGDKICGTVSLFRQLVLAESLETEPSSVVAARNRGSILWNDECRIPVEESGQRLPLLPVAFSQNKGSVYGATSADWLVDLVACDYEEWLEPTGRAVRVLINTEGKLGKLLSQADLSEGDDEVQGLVDEMEFDLLVTLIDGWSQIATDINPQEMDDDSVAAAVYQVAQAVLQLPGATMVELVESIKSDGTGPLLARVRSYLKKTRRQS